MAKKKAKKIGLFDGLMMLMALVGLVLAVVGICIPFFTKNTTVLNGEKVTNFGLFDDYAAIELAMEEGGLTIGLVQAFAIVSLVLTVLATLIVILGKLGILRFKGILKLIFAILVIVSAAPSGLWQEIPSMQAREHISSWRAALSQALPCS